jgi:hypothetical protein
VPGDAAEEAAAIVAAVRHDPALRLRLAGRFYDKQPGRVPIRADRLVAGRPGPARVDDRAGAHSQVRSVLADLSMR